MQTEHNFTPEPDNPTRKILIYVAGCLAFLACIGCAGIAAALGYIAWQTVEEGQDVAFIETAVPPVTLPVPTITSVLKAVPSSTPITTDSLATDSAKPKTTAVPPPTPTVTQTSNLNLDVPAEINQAPIPTDAYADLNRFLTTTFPPRDYYELGQRLGHYSLGERTVIGDSYEVGDSRSFFADGEPLEATLAAVTEHAYFWVENGIQLEKTAVAAAANRFEADYYALITDLFGTVWTPGIDNDPRFTILHMIGSPDAVELGYFTDVNQYPATVYSDSNEQEMIYLNMGQIEIGTDLYFGTLVHEVQHLIQWHLDANETAWLNEGLSQLAEIYVGLDTSTTEEYLYQTDIRLNSWSYEEDKIDAHYAGAYLYTVYIWEQLGKTAVQELARHPANGLAAVNSILQGYAPDRSLADFTADFAVANYLHDPAAGARYSYESVRTVQPSSEIYLNDIPLDTISSLNQFGVHYINLDFSGGVTIEFAGDTTIPIFDAPASPAEETWFAPPQNDTDAMLTAVLDLTSLGQATLRFNTWYDLEPEWDFAYLSVSSDGGFTWTLLDPVHREAGEYGPAWNGRSDSQSGNEDGWLKETISLNEFTGREIMLRFEVVTDSAVTQRGFALSNLRIPELATEIVWEAEGFVPTGWQLPQQWRLHFIQKGGGGSDPQVIPLPLDAFNQGRWPVAISSNGGVLVITPLTPFVAQPANYWLNIGK